MVRFKNRYLVIEIVPESDKYQNLQVKPNSLYVNITKQIEYLYGDFGVGAVRNGFTYKYCNDKTRIAVIRCRHGPHRLVASCLPFIRKIEDKPIIVNTLYTGATIRQCFKFVKNYQQRKYDEFCVNLKTDEERRQMKKVFMNFDKVLSIG